MKQKLLLKSMLLLFALIAGSSSVWADDEYQLYSGTIIEGDYVIYYDGYALKNSISNNRFENESVTLSNGKITNPAAAIVWHIAQNGDYWTIYNAAVSKYAGGNGSKNQGALLSTVTDYAKWTVTGSSTYDFENKGRAGGNTYTGNKWLRNNGTNGWACYASSTGGALSLYKKVLINPTITFNNGSVNVGKTLNLSTLFSSNSTGAVTYSIKEGGSYATLVGSTLTGVAVGSVTVQASQAATNNYNAKTVTATITVNAALTLNSIAITTPPTKTTYTEGETFDATGMVVTATYSDSSTDDVTASCTWTPDGALTLSDTEITISYTENATTKTATQVITVNPYVQPTSVTINLNNTLFGISTGNNATEQSKSVDNVTITTGCKSSASSKTYYDSNHIRLYVDSYLKLQAPDGYVITGVSLNRYSDETWNGDKVTPSTGAFDGTPAAGTAPLVWSGAATTVRFDYSGQCRTASVDVTLAEYKNVTITAATWASFSSDVALDFTNTDVTAYIAKEKDANNVTLTEIKKVPANTGIVVNGSAATHNIPVLTGDADATTGNLLKPWLTAGTPTEETYYTLAAGPTFKRSSGGTLAEGKAYLVMPAAAAPELGVDFGGTTGINAVNGSEFKVNGEYYNLAGQRVANPSKGLYIVNGKKVIVK